MLGASSYRVYQEYIIMYSCVYVVFTVIVGEREREDVIESLKFVSFL